MASYSPRDILGRWLVSQVETDETRVGRWQTHQPSRLRLMSVRWSSSFWGVKTMHWLPNFRQIISDLHKYDPPFLTLGFLSWRWLAVGIYTFKLSDVHIHFRFPYTVLIQSWARPQIDPAKASSGRIVHAVDELNFYAAHPDYGVARIQLRGRRVPEWRWVSCLNIILSKCSQALPWQNKIRNLKKYARQ